MIADCVDDRRPLIFREQRRMLRAHVAVGRDVAQERYAEPGRRAEVFDVAAMQRIERAIHHRDGTAVVLELFERQNHDFVVCPSCKATGRSAPTPARKRARRGPRVVAAGRIAVESRL